MGREVSGVSTTSRLKAIGIAVLVIASCGVFTSSAMAAVVNGDFETGTLEGWNTHYSNPSAGEWFVYPKEPGQGIFTPPSGNFAAGDEESGSDTLILYQDIAIPPATTDKLALTLYYESQAPIVVPTPNTLATPGPGFENQQLRVDVIRPTAAIESMAPGDILATLFANRTGDPEELGPTQVSADLSAFAGQTVRLRIANAVNDFFFFAGIDAVSLTSTPLPPPPPSNAFTLGALIKNKSKGTATLPVTVPGPGTLSVVGIGGNPGIRGVSAVATQAGVVKLTLTPTGSAKKILRKKGKLRFTAQVTFTPTGGTPATQTLKGTLILKKKKKHHKHPAGHH
jgi:hypothetical protein